MKGLSSKTQLNNEFKLGELAKSLGFSKEEKEEFRQVESITLTHALNFDTTGLDATENVELIYVYNIKVNTNAMPYKVIRALDKKTKAHTIFEVMTRDSECLSAEETLTPQLYKHKMWNCRTCEENFGATYTYIIANKKMVENISLGEYWRSISTAEWELPPSHNAKTLEDIYCLMLAMVLGVNRRLGERALELTARKNRITTFEKEIDKLERKRDSESQFNKKIELNCKIRALKTQIEGER